MSLIVSTHSDTFVSKMNNLYLLSKYKQQLNETASKTLQDRCQEDESVIWTQMQLELPLIYVVDTVNTYAYNETYIKSHQP